ncbi:hypothetical protein QTP86_012613 [Hemibagrus guttatus]|nr:hypothetical protein QTP86_012613 [Hemibagrus guttatus]
MWKGRELADVMERRKVDILCVQETRWKGIKVRSIGAGFKLFYYGVDSKRNGVGVVLKDMDVVNTYFQKREEHRVTYKSGGRRTQVDYILCRRGNLKEISDCKVVVGESVARQHRMVVCRMTLMVCKKKRSKIEIEKKTKWWKLKKEECCEEFRQKLRQALGGQVVLPDDWETTAEVIRETGRKVLGVSSGRRKEDKETWWWNEEVQGGIQRKRLAKKKWDMDRTEENRQEYKELQRRVKREVSKAKQKAYDELYTRLDTREGEKDLYRLARQRDRDGKDVQQVRVIKDRDGRVLTSEESVQRRWKEYFEELMNEENEREKRVEGVNSVEQEVDKIRKDEVRKALKRMKSGKAVGPDDILVEVWKCLGEAAVEFLANLFNRVLESERMPEEWRRSVLVPIFKNKGDVQSCSNYRGIKLMSHTMKLWKRVVEARLRKVVEICEQQYGFMPRKSTTDAIFALRILMEKYRDGQRELHCVFVDLEKAYDRVPREELWYCMRKSGVAEKYVRVVQDMYVRSRTVVRCAVGQTEEFKVEVGLHQGLALSPFLFAMVMDQLSEEVRQESPWTMMFADDIVICSESRGQVEENLERWRFALERRGMKVSRSKTEYMCVNEREGSGTVRLQGEEVKKVQEFKYLGSTVQSNGECGKEVKKRVQAGWNGWRKVWGVLCDQKISARIKGKVYRTVVRPAMLYGLETVSLRKRQESELEVKESGMSELRECDEASVSVEGDADVLLEEDEDEDEEEEDESASNKELIERLRELEKAQVENTSLALANESQREAYERCLDEDNAPCHKAEMLQEWFDDHNNQFEVLTPPPNSPDLNPIQLLWDVLDKQVPSMEAPPHNLQDLKDLMLTSWYQIPQHTFRDLVESMPRRDLREECIKLKMRVFDLERQNRTLTDFLTHKLHFSSSPLHQSSSVPCADHRSDPLLLVSEMPDAVVTQGKVTDSDECRQNTTKNLTQASASSMEAMSPFLKKKAHILEVLRKLEESDPLKFHPSACYHHHHHHHPHTQSILAGEVTSILNPSPHQHQCRQSSSDPDLHEHTHGISEGQQDSRASLNFGGCPSCLILQQRSSLELFKDNQALGVPSGSGKDEKKGQMQSEECDAEKALGQDKSNQPSSEDPKNECNKRQSSKISPSKSKGTNKYQQDKKSETISSPKGERMKESLKVATPSEKQKPEICNGDFSSSKETAVSKKASVGSYSSASLPERSTAAFLQQKDAEKKPTQSPVSLCGESKPSTSMLLKLLRIPSASENMASRLSPQLTRNSKIPCRNYEMPTRKATTTERTFSPKTGSHPGTHSAPTSPPNPEETSSVNIRVPGFSSQSTPKPSKDSKAGSQVPHYKNVVGPSTSSSTTATKDTTELSEKQKMNWRDEKVLNPLSSESSTSTSESSSSSSDQDTDTESPVWQRSQQHFSLPNSSSSANKSQRMSYPGMKDGYNERGPTAASPKGGSSSASQVVVKRRDRQPSVQDRREIISSYSETSYHPFKERLAVLGRLQNVEDLHQPGIKRGAQGNVSRAAASAGKGERSKTAERQIERITMEQRKHTGSLEGKSYPKNSFGNYAKVHTSSSSAAAAAERKYITKPDSQKTRAGLPLTSSCETLVVMRSYGKCPNPMNKTVPSPQSSPTRGQSKPPSKAGNASSYPRGMKPVQEEHLNLQKHQSPKPAAGKKKIFTHVDTFPPPLPSKSALDSAKSTQDKRPSVPQSSIEQKVMRGIQENVLKLQEQDRGHAVETKQKASNGIASWFGLKKSKLPALSRKPEMSKIKSNTSSSSTSSGTKDISGAKGGSRKVVESLNISKLMEKAEDLRKALEDERVYVKGVGIPLDRSARGRSCEVIVDQTQGQLSLMYAGVTGDSFMQQLLNRVDESGASSFGIMHRRLSFDSKRSHPVFSHQQSCVRQTRSGEDVKCSETSRGDDVTSDESLAESVSSQHFKGSMRTLDSGIGTFPLPDYMNSAAGKLNPKLHGSSVSHQAAVKPRKTRTLEGGLASLDEVNTSVLYTKGTRVHLSSTIHEDIDVYGAHFQAPPTANWAFPKPRGSEGQAEPPSQQTPSKQPNTP